MTIPQRQTKFSLLGDMPDFQERPLELMLELANEHPPLTKIQFAHVPQYVVSDPAAAKYVLQKNSRNYIKEQQMMGVTRSVLKTRSNLFTSDGDAWLKRRRTMQPTFHRKMIADFADTIVQEATATTNNLRDGQAFDMEEAMMETTMGVIGRTMLSRDILADYPQLYDAFIVASEHIIRRATTISGRMTPLFVPTAKNRAFNEAVATIRSMLDEVVSARLTMDEAERPNDLLTMMIAGRDEESGFVLSAENLMDELYGIVTAGHETSSITLAAMFYELAANDAVTDKLLAEIDSVLVGRLPNATDMSNLPYLQDVLAETMRRYPAAYVTTRQAIEPDQLLGHKIPAGKPVMINIYGLHHHNAYWRDPMAFDPNRWQRDDINHDAFLPFGAGPRKCIGEPLARLEMGLIAATILQRFRFQIVKPMKMEARFTLRAADGIWLSPIER